MKMAGQRRAIHDFVSGRDVIVSLPTGYGKSFCYALLPAGFDHLRLSIDCDLCFAADCHNTLALCLVVTGAAVLVKGRHSCNLLLGSLMMSFHLLT